MTRISLISSVARAAVGPSPLLRSARPALFATAALAPAGRCGHTDPCACGSAGLATLAKARTGLLARRCGHAGPCACGRAGLATKAGQTKSVSQPGSKRCLHTTNCACHAAPTTLPTVGMGNYVLPDPDSIKFPFRCKAAVLDDFNTALEVREIELAEPKHGELLVKVAATGICYSDEHIIKGEWPGLTALPMILGHEGSGIVVKCGPGVERFKPGDHVIYLFVPNCGVCHACQTGRPASCATAFSRPTGTMTDGTSRLTDLKTGKELRTCLSLGLFAEYTITSQDMLMPVKKEIPLNRASLVGCAVMTGVGTVTNAAKVEIGSTCVIYGCGGVGLNAVQGARIAGCDKIIAVDLLDNKLDFAREFGATHTLNGKKVDVAKEVAKLCPEGVDYVFDCIGSTKVIEQGFDMIKNGGAVVAAGIPPQHHAAQINAFSLVLSEKKLYGSLYGNARPHVDMPRLLNLYEQKRLKLDELVSREFSLEEINKGFEELRSGKVARGVINMLK